MRNQTVITFNFNLLFIARPHRLISRNTRKKYLSCCFLFCLDSRARTIVAFNPDQWSSWFEGDHKLSNMDLRPQGKQLVPNSQKFLDTGGDVFFLIMSDVEEDVEEIYRHLQKKLKTFCVAPDVTESSPPNKVSICRRCI